MAQSINRPMFKVMALLGLFIPAQLGVYAQSCDTTTCTSACLVFDASWNTCHNDWQNKGSDSLTSCLCRWNGLSATVSALAQCVACQEDGLASLSLQTYQIWFVICNTYLVYGEDQATQAADRSPTATILEVFSSSSFPSIESGICAEQSPSPTPSPSTTTTPSGSSTSPLRTTTPSTSPTPNAAGGKNALMAPLVALPVLVNFVAG